MKKYFNTAGPCNSNEHYIVPILERNTNIMSLMERRQYFVIHAARQTGKTTLVKAIVADINSKDDYYALYCSLEAVQPFKDPEKGIPQIFAVLKLAIEYSKIKGKENFGNCFLLTQAQEMRNRRSHYYFLLQNCRR